MNQKLQSLFSSVSPRTAWITIGSCVALWVLCLTGVLTPPLSAPASITLFWFYAMLMLVLASGVAAIGAAAALLVGSRRSQESRDPVADQEEQDQLGDLDRILDDPGTDAR